MEIHGAENVSKKYFAEGNDSEMNSSKKKSSSFSQD